MGVTLLRLAGALALLTLFVFSAVSYGELPARIPQHFDASGAPTREVATSIVSWFALPVIAAGVWGLVTWVGSRLPSQPELFNFPQKARFLALPPERRGPVLVEMRRFLDATALATVLLMGVVHLLVWRVATTGEAGALAQAPLLGLPLLLVVSVVGMIRLGRAVAEAERRLRDARG